MFKNLIDFGSPACSPQTPFYIFIYFFCIYADEATNFPTVISSIETKGSTSKIFFSTYSFKNLDASSLDKPRVV